MSPSPRFAISSSFIITGSWPQARTKSTRSVLRIAVVAVLTSGWQLTISLARRSSSNMTVTRPAVSLIRPNGVTAPGCTPSTSSSNSGAPKESDLAAPNRRRMGFRFTARSSSATISQSFLFLSRRNRFLMWAAGQFAAQRLALLHGVERRVLMGLGLDPQLRQSSKQVFARCGHISSDVASFSACAPRQR